MMIKPGLLLVALASPLIAQAERPITIGDRVMLVAPQSGYDKLTGRVVATTPDVISLDTRRGEMYVKRDEIVLSFRSVARHRRTLSGLVIGAPIGAGLGLWFGPKGRVDSGPGIDLDPGAPLFVRNAAVGAIAGTILGGIIGTLVRTDDWKPVMARPQLPGISIRF